MLGTDLRTALGLTASQRTQLPRTVTWVICMLPIVPGAMDDTDELPVVLSGAIAANLNRRVLLCAAHAIL